mmetsp:Transcript_13797/g.15726  ORF Transcript_13797/g.15726 Transcript_13797/m.15726 type:complete len:166 (+) Transcript_13797:1-498(+)
MFEYGSGTLDMSQDFCWPLDLDLSNCDGSVNLWNASDESCLTYFAMLREARFETSALYDEINSHSNSLQNLRIINEALNITIENQTLVIESQASRIANLEQALQRIESDSQSDSEPEATSPQPIAVVAVVLSTIACVIASLSMYFKTNAQSTNTVSSKADVTFAA